MSRHGKKDRQLRAQIALQAARIMAEQGQRDYQSAKRKAADRLGISEQRHLPSNQEIEAALLEHQRLFHAQDHARTLHHLRQTALQAMRVMEAFQPRLVGPVLAGSAAQHTPVQLHAFSDTPEEVLFFLTDHGIPYQSSEKRLRVGRDHHASYPTYHVEINHTAVEITVFPVDGMRQSPRNPVDGKPMPRADIHSVEALLAAS